MDSNAHHRSWGSPFTDLRGRIINDWVEDYTLLILDEDQPIFLSSSGSLTHIDLTISSNALSIKTQWEVYPDCFHSNHFPVVVTLEGTGDAAISKPHWNTNRADWPLSQASLQLPSVFLSPSEACSTVEARINAAATKSIPLSHPAYGKSKLTKCWWTRKCTTAVCRKKAAYNRFKKHWNNIGLWIAYKRVVSEFRHTIKEAQRASWQSYVASINRNTSSSQVWRKVKKISGRSSIPAIVLKNNGNIIADRKQVANCLAEEFSKRGNNQSPQFQRVVVNYNLVPVHFSGSACAWYTNHLH